MKERLGEVPNAVRPITNLIVTTRAIAIHNRLQQSMITRTLPDRYCSLVIDRFGSRKQLGLRCPVGLEDTKLFCCCCQLFLKSVLLLSSGRKGHDLFFKPVDSRRVDSIARCHNAPQRTESDGNRIREVQKHRNLPHFEAFLSTRRRLLWRA